VVLGYKAFQMSTCMYAKANLYQSRKNIPRSYAGVIYIYVLVRKGVANIIIKSNIRKNRKKIQRRMHIILITNSLIFSPYNMTRVIDVLNHDIVYFTWSKHI
jgi:hypothetical protein